VATLFSRGVRKELRTAQRLLGLISVDWAEDKRTARAYLDELMTLYQARWETVGQPGAFALVPSPTSGSAGSTPRWWISGSRPDGWLWPA
jgi:hypothetical protein